MLNQRDTNLDKEILPIKVKPIATGKVNIARYIANVFAKDKATSPSP